MSFAISQAHSVVSGFLETFDRVSASLPSENKGLRLFLADSENLVSALFRSAPRISLEGPKGTGLFLQCLQRHRVKAWVQLEQEAPLKRAAPWCVGQGTMDFVIHGLLTALEGGEGETKGRNSLSQAIHPVATGMVEGCWALYVSSKTLWPRTLSYLNPDHTDSSRMKNVTLWESDVQTWTRQLNGLLVGAPDFLTLTLDDLRKSEADVKGVIETLGDLALTYESFLAGGLVVHPEAEFPRATPGDSWYAQVPFLSVDDFERP